MTESSIQDYASHYSGRFMNANYWLLACAPWALIAVSTVILGGAPVPVVFFGSWCALIGAFGVYLRVSTRVADRLTLDPTARVIVLRVSGRDTIAPVEMFRSQLGLMRYPNADVTAITLRVRDPGRRLAVKRYVFVSGDAHLLAGLRALGFFTGRGSVEE